MNGSEDRPSPESTLAVILGVSKCPKSPQLAVLPGSANSADGFYRYLTNEFGLPEENVLLLFDSFKSPSSQIQDIGEWLFQRRTTLRDLICFYTGHGGFTPRDRKFFLAVRTTTERSEGATSIRMVDLSTELGDKAPWARKYLILDCCFAGSSVVEFMASAGSVAVDKTKENFPAKGMTILCSSSARDVSIAPLGGHYTMFSEALLEVLHTENERVQADLSLHDIGLQVRERIREKYPDSWMRPEIHSPDQSEGDIASVRLFPNATLKAFRVSKRQQEEQERLAAEQREREMLEAEERQRAQERLAAEQRQREQAEAKERADKERLDAEQRQRAEQERLEAERREKKEAVSPIVPPSAALSQDRGPAQAETPPTVQSKDPTKQKLSKLIALIVVFALILVVGLIWFASSKLNHNPQEASPVTSTLTPTPTLTPTQTAAFYFFRGSNFSKNKEYDKAISDYTEAIRLDPKDANAYNNRGYNFNELRQYDNAIRDYTEAIRLDPKHANAYHNRGFAFDELKQYDNAIKDYTEAIRLDPNLGVSYHNRGSVYQELGQNAQAQADFKKAKQLGYTDSQ